MSKIDTTLQPSPTGAAAVLAATHSEGGKPITLYGGWFCPFVQRAWIVLEEKKVKEYQYVEINPYRKEEDFLRLNPRGLVPTLVFDFSSFSSPSSSQAREGDDEGKEKKKRMTKGVLYESMVICEFLDELFSLPSTTVSTSNSNSTSPDKEDENNSENNENNKNKEIQALLPRGNDNDDDPIKTTFQRARCRLWMDHVASRIVPGFYRLLQCDPQDATALATARKQFLGALKAFVREMMIPSDDGSDSNEEEGERGKKGGPWFLGEKFSLVDVMLAPWAMRLFLIDYYKPGGVGIPPPRPAPGPPPDSASRGQQQKQGKEKVDGDGDGDGDGKGDEREDEKGDEDKDKDEAAVWERWHVWFEAVKTRKSVRDTWSDDEEYVKAYKRYADDTTQSEVGRATRRGERLP